MSTRQNRLAADQGARPCPGHDDTRSPLTTAMFLSADIHGQEARQAGNEEDRQDEAAGLDAVVVTGVRASLTVAQKTEQNAGQIVAEQIVAENIGKLPDASVADALQRIAGVHVDRNVREGNEIAIRGLTRVRSELNGPRSFEFKAAKEFVSGNIAGVDHAPDIDGDGNSSNDMDSPVPIGSNTSLATRH